MTDENAITNKIEFNCSNKRLEDTLKDINTNTVGGKIKYYRTLKGWSQFELARHLGLTPEQGRYLIKDYETRGLNPPLELSIKLSRIFNLNTIYFYDNYYEFLNSNYSKKILGWRKENKLTITAAAKKINVSYCTWSSWEKGKKVGRENYEKLKLLLNL